MPLAPASATPRPRAAPITARFTARRCGRRATRCSACRSTTTAGPSITCAPAKKSIARAERIFRLYGAGERVKHVVFDSGHDYSKPMREAMYGWMTRSLKGTGDGAPIEEPKHEVETPEALACFPDPDKRPATWLY